MKSAPPKQLFLNNKNEKLPEPYIDIYFEKSNGDMNDNPGKLKVLFYEKYIPVPSPPVYETPKKIFKFVQIFPGQNKYKSEKKDISLSLKLDNEEAQNSQIKKYKHFVNKNNAEKIPATPKFNYGDFSSNSEFELSEERDIPDGFLDFLLDKNI